MTKSPRRVHDSAFKTKVVLEALKGAKTLAQLRHSCPTDYRLEEAGPRWATSPFRVNCSQTNALRTTARTDRRPSLSTNWAVEGRKRLAQKKIANQLTLDRRTLIDPTDERFSVAQQCTLLGLARSSYYHQPVGESDENLALMERIDKLFTARPEMGVRRMYYELTTPENPVNIKRIRRLMRLMGLEAIGPKPNLSKPQQGHTIYPYLLKGLVIDRPNHVWSTDITYVPMANGFYTCVPLLTGLAAVS